MTLADTSVWIDWIANRSTPQAACLDRFVEARQPVIVADLVLMEVLQGARDEGHADKLFRRLTAFPMLATVSPAIAVAAARNYRLLLTRGVTPHKTIDILIATRCIIDGIPLLYSDRDFDPFVRHLGLQSALETPGAI